MRRYSLFVLDDDPFYIQSVRLALSPDWYVTDKDLQADAALIDIHLEGQARDFAGLKKIKALRKCRPSLHIIATSGDLNRDTMEKALDAGCDLFLAKPLKQKQLQILLQKTAAYLQLRELPSSSTIIPWIGESPQSLSVKSQIAQLKGEDGPILIQGETGSGKEVVAQLLHQQEGVRPFVRVNVAALSSQLFESELFGHIKGAFTGALQDRMGLIEAADGGDLFLDEIETLTEAQQASLLRFLESGEIKAVGATQAKGISTRVIAATNENLEALVKSGKFREDLYWRLAKHKIQLPSLRERTEDLAALCAYFFEKLSAEPKTLTHDGLEALQNLSWPGNVRELKRASEQLQLHAPLPIIRAEDISILLHNKQSKNSFKVNYNDGLEEVMKSYEAQIIKQCLSEFKNIDETARTLKISRSSLYKKLKDYNIEWESNL